LTLFRGPAVPANQIHDFHPPIAPSGLYWIVPVPAGGLTISADANTFTLQMKDVRVVDQPRWPALDSIATPARMTFKMVWKSAGEPVTYDDASRQFRFTGFRASRRKSRCLQSDFHGSLTRWKNRRPRSRSSAKK